MDFDRDNPLAAEIQHEMAANYFAGCRKMVDALEAIKAFDRALAASTPDSDQIARRTELLEAAGERVHFMVIQREAMKLSCIEKFFEDYEIPDEVRTGLRPKQRK